MGDFFSRLFFDNPFLLYLGLGTLVLFIRAIFGKPNYADYNSSSQYPSFFTEEMKRRFPKERIFFLPKTYIKKGKIIDFSDSDHIFINYWEKLLKSYPDHPQNVIEQKEREQKFWNYYLIEKKVTTTTANGELVLRPDQFILDYFKVYELWIFRRYFAATGIVHESFFKKYVYLFMELQYYKKLSNLEITRLCAVALDHFTDVEMPAHFKQWSGWFLFNIQEAFEAQAKAPKPMEPESIEGEAKPTAPKQGRIYEI